MMTDPKLNPINNCDFYPDHLKVDIEAFNSVVERVETARAAITAEADALREQAIKGAIEKPDRLSADVAKLIARRIALDAQEIALIIRKETFQAGVLTARKAERERLLALEQERRAEIIAGLKTVGIESGRLNELLNGDTKVRAFAAARSEVSSYLHVIVEADQQRLAVLQGRMAAALPEIAN